MEEIIESVEIKGKTYLELESLNRFLKKNGLSELDLISKGKTKQRIFGFSFGRG